MADQVRTSLFVRYVKRDAAIRMAHIVSLAVNRRTER